MSEKKPGWVKLLEMSKELKELTPEVEAAIDWLLENVDELTPEQLSSLVRALLLAPPKGDAEQVLGGVIKR